MFRIFTTSVLIFVSCALTVHAACVCNEKGIDGCGPSCSGTTIVRPRTKVFDRKLNLPPIGDNCWCSKMLIEPATLPKTCGKSPKPKSECDCSQCQQSQYNHHAAYDSHTYVEKDDYSMPADPISLSLAIQAGKAIAVPEAKLAYGFTKKPIDELEKVYFSDVPEENLYKLNQAIITYKKPQPYIPKAETLPEEPEEDEPMHHNPYPTLLTYQQLGYVADQHKRPKFSRMCSGVGLGELTFTFDKSYVTSDSGFKPGRVVSFCKQKTTLV